MLHCRRLSSTNIHLEIEYTRLDLNSNVKRRVKGDSRSVLVSSSSSSVGSGGASEAPPEREGEPALQDGGGEAHHADAGP